MIDFDVSRIAEFSCHSEKTQCEMWTSNGISQLHVGYSFSVPIV